MSERVDLERLEALGEFAREWLLASDAKTVEQAIAELRRLRGMEADAERYRYLRERMDDCAAEVTFSDGERWFTAEQSNDAGPALDSLVDAARAVHPSALSEQNSGGRKP